MASTKKPKKAATKKPSAKKPAAKAPAKKPAKAKAAPKAKAKAAPKPPPRAKTKAAPKPKAAPRPRAAAKPAAGHARIDVTAFLAALPPMGDVQPPRDPALAALAGRLPDVLLDAFRRTGWGRFGNGFLLVCGTEALDDTLAEWLGRKDPTRTPFARTALGDIIYYRDLRARARELGMTGPEAETACDVSILDVRYKRTAVLATTPAGFFADVLGDPAALRTDLRKDLFDAAFPRLGAPSITELYGFVPALGLGGEENPANLDKLDAAVHLEILRQL